MATASRIYRAGRQAADFLLKGRALMLVRNVGHLMTNPAILMPDGNDIPEGLMDALITTLIAMHDLRKRPARATPARGRSMW
jgi:malate synthase